MNVDDTGKVYASLAAALAAAEGYRLDADRWHVELKKADEKIAFLRAEFKHMEKDINEAYGPFGIIADLRAQVEMLTLKVSDEARGAAHAAAEGAARERERANASEARERAALDSAAFENKRWKAALAESAGRLKVLEEKAAEVKAEWVRAEKAEADLARLRHEARHAIEFLDDLEASDNPACAPESLQAAGFHMVREGLVRELRGAYTPTP